MNDIMPGLATAIRDAKCETSILYRRKNAEGKLMPESIYEITDKTRAIAALNFLADAQLDKKAVGQAIEKFWECRKNTDNNMCIVRAIQAYHTALKE